MRQGVDICYLCTIIRDMETEKVIEKIIDGIFKTCNKCGIQRPIDEFRKSKTSKDGYLGYCNFCFNKQQNKRLKEYYNKEKNTKARRDRQREFYRTEKYKKWARKYYKKPKQRLRNAMAQGIRNSIKNKGGKSWESLVDFNFKELKEHLEKRFQKGMNFENYGRWHIDHIIPVSRFDFVSPKDKEFKMCWSLNNLQPMWGDENLSKNADLCYTENEYKDLGVHEIYKYIKEK